MRRAWSVALVVPVAAAGLALARPADGPPRTVPYQWVDPPAFFASGNTAPAPYDGTIALGPSGSEAAGFATPDGQLAVNLPAGAIVASPGARRVAVRVDPLAASALPAVRAPQRANGNAYRVTMRYEPSGRAVASFAVPGTLTLQVPEVGGALLRRAGPRWQDVDAAAVPAPQITIGATLARPGTYVGATDLPELVGPGAGPDDGVSTAAVAGVIAGTVLVVALGFGAVLWARRRRRRAA